MTTQIIAALIAASTALSGGAAAANVGTLAARDVICVGSPDGEHSYEWKDVVLSYTNNNDGTHTATYQMQKVCTNCNLIREKETERVVTESHNYDFDRLVIEKNIYGENVIIQVDKCTVCGIEERSNYNPYN